MAPTQSYTKPSPLPTPQLNPSKPSTGKRYLKGFEISRRKIARELAETDDELDPEVDTYIPIVVSLIPRDAYINVDLGIDPDTGGFVLIIVLQRGPHEEELRGRDLGPIDPSLEQAKGCALAGPDVWEAEY